jgi:hypothetical protein
VTIGGDDTAFSASRLAGAAGGGLRVAHVPKTIDNDLPLPGGVPTFGFETARSVGVQLVNNLMTDAITTQRWYLVVAMGRSAGHLALGIGKSAGATLTVIAEEFPRGEPIRLSRLVDVLETSMLKRIAHGRPPRPGADPPSAKWLGRHADRTEFSTSSLWNVDHVHHCETGFPDLLNKLIQRSIKPPSSARRAEARIVRSWVTMAAQPGPAFQRSGPGRRLREVPGSGLVNGEYFLARASPSRPDLDRRSWRRPGWQPSKGECHERVPSDRGHRDEQHIMGRCGGGGDQDCSRDDPRSAGGRSR